MSRRVKTAIVLLCFSLCGASIIIVSTAHQKKEPQKINAIPVKNREIARQDWLQA